MCVVGYPRVLSERGPTVVRFRVLTHGYQQICCSNKSYLYNGVLSFEDRFPNVKVEDVRIPVVLFRLL